MTPEQVMYNIIILQPMQVNILISIKQHHQLFHFGVTSSYGRMVSMSRIVNLLDCCITVVIVLLQRQQNISWLHHGTSSYQQQQSSHPFSADLHMDA